MVQAEIDKLDETLPYGATSEDVLNLIDAIKIKYDNDKGIKQVYGKTNIENARKIIKVLGISDDGTTFTKHGRKYAYEADNDTKQLILLKLILKYAPYEYFLLNVSNEKLSETSLEIIQNYWGKNTYGASEYNRNNASISFAQLVELAGLGTFKLGRKGKSTRIEWNPKAATLIRDTYQEISSKPDEKTENSLEDSETPQVSIVPWAESVRSSESMDNQINTETNDKEEELIRKVLEKSLSDEQKNDNSPQVNVSVNIDMTDWEVNKIISFFKATRGIFENANDL